MKTMFSRLYFIGQVGELSPSPNAMKRMTRGINEHWKPVYLNCAPCNEDYQVRFFDFVAKIITFCALENWNL